MVRQYSLDEENLVLHETWSFGLGEGIHSEAAGGATRLPSGNTLHHFGATPRAREITHDGAVVWDVAWEGQNIIGYMTPLQDLYSYVP